ncbi:MAG: hypothetical protein KKE44_15505 [Proteobacteria bacterium]|nr:hypothetical protein [Pseudomonadota bacterium]MBU1584135.1 hypothetical protein [Pseudomonadota bacterium]MBU2452304.1 hypothetical protein [Pseudomonadota bacterium]MBU2630154.1 hypothetical protein [Pseudomonadota bacterium]
MIKEMNAKVLERFIKDMNEKEYLIVDVRQYEEYRLDHIPGATHIPLAEIQFDPYVFDDDRKLIFYCRSGSRSKVAAIFVAEAGYDEDKLYHLKGGMLEYTGEILLDIPRVDLFPLDVCPEDIMEKLIDFEKGAFVFYTLAKEKVKGSELYEVMKNMAQAEISHGKSIYNQMKKNNNIQMDFDLFFNACKGEILEGGKTLEYIESFLLKTSSKDCIAILEFAIDLEFSAYDLYKTMAQTSTDKRLTKMFYTLAQAEKKHLEKIIQSLELCEKES